MRLWAPFRLLLVGWALIWLAALTLLFGGLVIVGSLVRASEQNLQVFPRLWARLLLMAACCRVKVYGRENLRKGEAYVFASNHTSALDILVFLSELPPNFRWLAKKELFEIFFFGPAMARAGYIPIDRSDSRQAVKSIKKAAGRIKTGASVVIFPEGTRSADGGLLPFKSGGLSLAIMAKAQVVPVAIMGASSCLPPNTLRLNPGLIEIHIGKPIDTGGYKLKQRNDLAMVVEGKVRGLLEAAKENGHG